MVEQTQEPFKSYFFWSAGFNQMSNEIQFFHNTVDKVGSENILSLRKLKEKVSALVLQLADMLHWMNILTWTTDY